MNSLYIKKAREVITVSIAYLVVSPFVYTVLLQVQLQPPFYNEKSSLAVVKLRL